MRKLLPLLLMHTALSVTAHAQTQPDSAERARQLAADVMSPDPAIREQARSDLINKIGPAHNLSDAQRLAAVLPAIRTPAPDPAHDDMQGLLVEYLSSIAGAEARQALPILLAYITDPNVSNYLRRQSIQSVVRIAPDDKQVAITLIHMAETTDGTGFVDESLEQLGLMGKAAAGAKPLLRKTLTHPIEDVQSIAFRALGRIVFAESPETDFTRALLDQDPDIRAAAHIQIRRHATLAPTTSELAKVASATPAQRTAYRQQLLAIFEGKSQPYDRHAAMETLSEIGPGSDPRLIEALLPFVDTRDAFFAERALRLLEPTDPAAAAMLIARVHNAPDPRQHVVLVIVRSLTRYGTLARDAVADLLTSYDRLLALPNHGFSDDEVRDYLIALATLAPENLHVQRRVVDLTAADHPLNHPPEPYRSLQAAALDALALIGLPTDAALHKKTLAIVTEILALPRPLPALRILQKSDPAQLASDAPAILPLLVKILETPQNADPLKAQPQDHGEQGRARVAAATVLGKFGPAAKTTVPLLQTLAARPMLTTLYNMADMLENQVTSEAAKALKLIE